MKNLRIAIFEDNQLFRDMLFYLINGTEGYVCSGCFADASDLKQKIEKASPNVVLMDIDLPTLNGIDATQLIKNDYPMINVCMLTVFEDETRIYNAICAGASGYLLKNTPPAKILESLSDIHSGGAPLSSRIAKKVLSAFRDTVHKDNSEFNSLTEREVEVLRFLVKGFSFKMIAHEFKITEHTIKFHVKNIYSKLYVKTKTEAVVKAVKEGLV